MNRITSWAVVLVILGLLLCGAAEFIVRVRWWVTALVVLALIGGTLYRERARYLSGYADGDAP